MINGTRALFDWSLRSDTKSIYPHILRAVFTGFLLITILLAWAESASGIAPGLSFLTWIARINVLLIGVSGISYFVSAVTEEKTSGTLALLRLAGVSPLAIVLSNSTSRLISACMLLLIQLPFVFLAITLGGVTWQQVIAVYLALMAWMCMVANIALFCSVRCRTSGRAASLATSTLLLLFAIGPILQSVAGLTSVPWISAEFRAACAQLLKQQQAILVTSRLDRILGSNAVPDLLSWQLQFNILVGIVLFVTSVLMFNRYSDLPEDNPHGTSARVRRFTIGRCWRHAIVWKDFLFHTGGRSFLLTKVIGYATFVLGFVWYHQLERPNSSTWLSADLTQTAFLSATLLLSIEILLYSSNSLYHEVRMTSVGALRMLPITTPVLLMQKLGACLIALSPVLMTLAIIFLYNPQAITRNGDFPGQVVAWLFMTLLSSHFTVLLSLYTKWAALPLAVFLTMISFPCIGGAAIGLTAITRETAQLNGIPWAAWFGVFVNAVWMWLFVLLPIEIEIVNRWNRLSRV